MAHPWTSLPTTLGRNRFLFQGMGMLNGDGSTNGAIYNSSGTVFPAVQRVTLLGDTAFGGPEGGLATSNRWDLRSSTTSDANGASLSVSPPGSAYKLIKVGNNQVSLTGVTVDPALGDIDIRSGVLSIESATTGLGDLDHTLTVENGATLSSYQATNLFNKHIVLNGNGFNHVWARSTMGAATTRSSGR